jgi:RNA polymerase sigma-70 factor (ECF subfamily)
MNQENSSTEKTALNPETWVDHYGDYLYCFAISRVRDPSVAEDLVQETFLAALDSIVCRNFLLGWPIFSYCVKWTD